MLAGGAEAVVVGFGVAVVGMKSAPYSGGSTLLGWVFESGTKVI
ncbi:hypothetical protein LEP1GSC058_2552 [Leptospira fainei serovar Hurstbridge str. BUT 6]|uniref:Uncharacterized protein n=1 Tax=Leptospira fainei serovar Hurstbridge str. BUT 6 TaxID=1193011 RepID=S3VAK9_9LEPT|nr:hypothetical protein LEP1GSC058_2552 [Leptospira fainei serovar Hurstbridge str. BUT 6]